jgi:hypothetical protein
MKRDNTTSWPESIVATHTSDLGRADATIPVALLEIVADLRGVTETELDAFPPAVADCIERLEADPPPVDTHPSFTFTHEGYRITLYRD